LSKRAELARADKSVDAGRQECLRHVREVAYQRCRRRPGLQNL
jgi:hypothetical protein